MKTINILEDAKRNHIISQLHQAKCMQTEGKSYQELKYKLAIIKATNVNNV